MKSVRLDQIFSPAQCMESERLLAGRLTDIQRVDRLKEYLSQHKEMLEAQGIVPDYLAYAITYTATTGRAANPDELLKHWNDLAAGPAPTSKPRKPRRKKGKQ